MLPFLSKNTNLCVFNKQKDMTCQELVLNSVVLVYVEFYAMDVFLLLHVDGRADTSK
jgi:hypothetical protein